MPSLRKQGVFRSERATLLFKLQLDILQRRRAGSDEDRAEVWEKMKVKCPYCDGINEFDALKVCDDCKHEFSIAARKYGYKNDR